MMRVLKIAQSATLPRLAVLAIAGLGLAGCYDNGGDPKVQIGANPVLPPLQQYLIPPIRIAKVVPWGTEAPTVPHGLQVHALATGFEHPRSLYVLPNGDVLVAETNSPAKPDDSKGLVGWVGKQVLKFAGADAPFECRIASLFDASDQPKPF